MSWCDSSDFEIFGGISSQFEYLGTEVLEDRGAVDSGSRTDSVLLSDSLFEESVESSNWELERVRWVI